MPRHCWQTCPEVTGEPSFESRKRVESLLVSQSHGFGRLLGATCGILPNRRDLKDAKALLADLPGGHG
jgi:hypothetical protein